MVMLKSALVSTLLIAGANCAVIERDARILERASEKGLQNRWDTISKQVGPAAMQELCQSVMGAVPVTVSTTVVEPSPTTVNVVAQVTDYTTITVDLEVTTQTTKTIESVTTQTVTSVLPARRSVMDGMRNAFAGLFRDDSPWVLAKCGASFQPLTATTTSTIIETTPTIVATDVTTITETIDVSVTNEIPVTSTISTTATSTVTEVVTVPAPFPESDCPGFISEGRVPWAVYETLDIQSPNHRLLFGVASRDACHNLCAADPDCVASTYKNPAEGACFVVYSIPRYFVNWFFASVRGRTCTENLQPATQNYKCCTQYRDASQLHSNIAGALPDS